MSEYPFYIGKPDQTFAKFLAERDALKTDRKVAVIGASTPTYNAATFLEKYGQVTNGTFAISTPNPDPNLDIQAIYEAARDKKRFDQEMDATNFAFNSTYEPFAIIENTKKLIEYYNHHKGYLLNTRLISRLYNYKYLDFVLDFLRYDDFDRLTRVKSINATFDLEKLLNDRTPVSGRIKPSTKLPRYCKYKVSLETLQRYEHHLKKTFINYMCISTLKDESTYQYSDEQLKLWIDTIKTYSSYMLTDDARMYLRLAGY